MWAILIALLILLALSLGGQIVTICLLTKLWKLCWKELPKPVIQGEWPTIRWVNPQQPEEEYVLTEIVVRENDYVDMSQLQDSSFPVTGTSDQATA